MKKIFAPGCALIIYKPELSEKIHRILKEYLGDIDLLNLCCKNHPELTPGTDVINVCPGCDKRFKKNYDDISTISLWEILSENDIFQFPDYKGKEMSIIDACPTRNEIQIHKAIRTLLKRMNIKLIEPTKTGIKSSCCGDSYYGVIPTEKLLMEMKKKSSEMPVDDVVVYCVSCSKSVFLGGKKPHYMIDLLFNEETIPKIYEPDEWHKELDEYINDH